MDSHGPCDPSVETTTIALSVQPGFLKSMIASHFTLGKQMFECDESAGMLLVCDSGSLMIKAMINKLNIK